MFSEIGFERESFHASDDSSSHGVLDRGVIQNGGDKSGDEVDGKIKHAVPEGSSRLEERRAFGGIGGGERSCIRHVDLIISTR